MDEILISNKIKDRFVQGKKLFEEGDFKGALEKFLPIQHAMSPPGVDPYIYQCCLTLRDYDKIIPALETTVRFSKNINNAEMWRQLGLLYLANEKDVAKACRALERAVELDPALIDRNELGIIYSWKVMLLRGFLPTEVFCDLDSGNCMVKFSGKLEDYSVSVYISYQWDYYHLDPNCELEDKMQDLAIAITRNDAEERGFYPCPICVVTPYNN